MCVHVQSRLKRFELDERKYRCRTHFDNCRGDIETNIFTLSFGRGRLLFVPEVQDYT